MGSSTGGDVRIVSRRLVRPEPAGSPDTPPEVIHLTPWDLTLITLDHIQKGILLPKPHTTGGAALADELASSLARALGRFYPLAGRLVASEITGGGDSESAAEPGPRLAISLHSTGEGTEFVHAVAPGVTVSDIVTPLYTPPVVSSSFFPLNGLLNVEAVVGSLPVLAAQVTELADGVFVAVSLNHGVADGTTFWHLFNAWSEINRRCRRGDGEGFELSTPPPVMDRWFVDACPVPIPLPFSKPEDLVRRPEYTPVQECFLHFSAESIKKLKAKANAEMAAAVTEPPAAATTTLSSLQSLLGHLWRALCRARCLAPDQETMYVLAIGLRGRVRGIPQEYVGNAVVLHAAASTVGDVLQDGGLGRAAWLLNRAVASFDEAKLRRDVAAWARAPVTLYVTPRRNPARAVTGSSPRFDVYGNDFGWGRPVAVRSGAGNKVDGKVTVYEGREGGGSIALEVCLSPEALARLVADEEFMEAVTSNPQSEMEGSTAVVRIVSRRLVRPESPDGGGVPSSEPPEVMHLTPWDLRVLTVDYIQKGLLLPKPPTGGQQLADSLASSLARALARFYPLAGRLAVAPAEATTSPGPPGIVVSLVCNGEGAEFVHAVAPDVTVSDITDPVYIPSAVVWSLFPLNGLLSADAALADPRPPVLAAQVTELADGVFVAVSLNHTVADGTTFWHLFNTWSEISRRSSGGIESFELSSPAPALERWFVDGSPVPITLPFAKLEDIVRRPAYPPVRECFFHFSAESVKKLKAKANAEMAGTTAPATTTISSLQSLLAHMWRAACRARDLAPDREAVYVLLVGCRARVRGVPEGYLGNTVTNAMARSAAGEVVRDGLGRAAWLLNRAVASFDEARVRGDLAAWAREPDFMYVDPSAAAWLGTGSSPRFDVYGNDFGWGRPVAVRSGAGNKFDGKVTVYEGRDGGGSMALEVCLVPEVLARLLADDEFMEAVST
ncbi:hypothetical protein U9M48_041253 [Paspalum notatum var. saurae]|uniref:HXXXD-type acyl-transferase family protein n=1 Tax=Paspalum notatum var. saurae TaxID=547442 RepID=A0AAQ3USA1_PASNO